VRSEGRGFHIYRATQKSGKYTRISNEVLINTNQFTDTLANTGDSLYYAVTAINSDGLESVRSLPAGIFVGDALQAIPLLIVAENGTTNFRWPAGNSQIKRVELEFSPVDSDDIKVLKSENAETGSLSLSAAPEGKYRIRGIDAKGRRTSEGNWVSYP
jgi:fibronectin type 3 domain-containing protein